jgi:hypothetical protein
MIEKTMTTPHEDRLLRRLASAGCPINWEELAEPCSPLRIIHEPAALGTELFPLGDRIGLACCLRITASVPFTITAISLGTGVTRGSLTWLTYCEQHGKYCFHDCCKGDVRIAADGVLNRRIMRGLRLKRGESVRGYIALILSEGMSPNDMVQKATLRIHDQFDKSYPYRFELDASQQITGRGDRNCYFISAAELEQERAARLAAEAQKAKAKIKPAGSTITESTEHVEKKEHDAEEE